MSLSDWLGDRFYYHLSLQRYRLHHFGGTQYGVYDRFYEKFVDMQNADFRWGRLNGFNNTQTASWCKVTKSEAEEMISKLKA